MKEVFTVIVYASDHSKEPRLHGIFSKEKLAKESILECGLLSDPSNVILFGKVQVDAVNPSSISIEDIDFIDFYGVK